MKIIQLAESIIIGVVLGLLAFFILLALWRRTAPYFKERLIKNRRLANINIGPLSLELCSGVTNGELKAGVDLFDFSLVEDGLFTFLHIHFYLISFCVCLTLFEPVYVLANKE